MVTKGIQLLQGIDTVIIRVSNIEVATEWYTDKLGLKITWDDPKMKLVVLDTVSATSLTLWQTDHKITLNQETASYPIFRTPDASLLRKELIERGINCGEIIRDDHVTYFLFYDPDGNILEACEVHE